VIQYRAVLIDPGKPQPQRPIQTITMSLSDVDLWIAEVLGGGTQLQGPAKIQVSDQAKVLVYVTEEKLTATYTVEMARKIRKDIIRRRQHQQETES